MMDLNVGDVIELINGKISEVKFVGEDIHGHIVYGCGFPIVVVSLENIKRKIEK